MAESGRAEQRTERGTFAPGHAGGPGRPRNAITNALRRMVDPEEVAQFLINAMRDPSLPGRDRIAAAREIFDRTEGKATQTVDVHAQVTARAALPARWDLLTQAEQLEWIDQFERSPQRYLPAGGDE